MNTDQNQLKIFVYGAGQKDRPEAFALVVAPTAESAEARADTLFQRLKGELGDRFEGKAMEANPEGLSEALYTRAEWLNRGLRLNQLQGFHLIGFDQAPYSLNESSLSFLHALIWQALKARLVPDQIDSQIGQLIEPPLL